MSTTTTSKNTTSKQTAQKSTAKAAAATADRGGFTLPKLELPEIDADRVAQLAKDAFFITVGFGVLAFQKAQVRRVELTKLVNKRFDAGQHQVNDIVKAVEAQIAAILPNDLPGRLASLESKLDGVVKQVQSQLPDPAADLLGQAHTVARSARKQVVELIHNAA